MSMNATSNLRLLTCVLMPVNIQLSKISIATAISKPKGELTNCCMIDSFFCVVGPDGIEPSTSPLSGVRSSHLSYGPRWANTGGAGRDRTGDLLNANQALSQLSYSPLFSAGASSGGAAKINQSRPVGYRDQRHQASSRFRNTPIFPKWRSGSGLTNRSEEPSAVYGMERLLPTRSRCTLKRFLLSETPSTVSLRKEVIQPQVLLRLPCYDFTPIMDHTLGRCPPCGSACRLLVQSTFVM